MTRIGSSDHVLLLLREQLQRLGRGKAGRSARTSAGTRSTPGAMERLKAIAELDSVPDEQVRRTLVRALLTAELGEGLANEPALQSVFEEAYRIISESGEGRQLLDRALEQLRTAD